MAQLEPAVSRSDEPEIGRILPRVLAAELSGEALRIMREDGPGEVSTLLSTGRDDDEDK
jgi:hypothetical protein